MKLIYIFLLSVNLCFAKESYRAGVINAFKQNDDLNKYILLIQEAGQSDVDIVVLPSVNESGESSYDELVKGLAKAARQAGLYVVAHLKEKTRCQNKDEVVRNNLVFDRDGSVVSVYRKPVSEASNCTATPSEVKTFKTDFGVTFGLLMEEDLVLQSSEFLKKLKNIAVSGSWNSEIPFLSGDQFASAWAYSNKANLISHTGIYSFGADLKNDSQKMRIADISKNGEEHITVPVINPAKMIIAVEDLSQYKIKPLDVEANLNRYKEKVCHNSFCCEFDITTSYGGKDVNYGLAAFDGVIHYGGSHYIGAQSCGLYACAGLYKRSCLVGSENNTNIIFDKITITGNFSKQNSALYPIIVSTQSIQIDQFSFINTGKQATATLKDVTIFNFGIFSRDFTTDVESIYVDGNTEGLNYYDYIFNESVVEFFDYLWARLRILIIVVSIYILEMM